jgi:hypothetical protein
MALICPYMTSVPTLPWIGWVGRIAPEKGLEDAVAASRITGIALKIMGLRKTKPTGSKLSK